MDNNELTHHGIKGQRWGVRRFQNKDGTLTAKGKKRYNEEMDKLKQEEKVLKNKQRTQAKLNKLDAKRKELDEMKKSINGKTSTGSAKGKKDSSSEDKPKSIKDMSNAEIQARIDRIRLEQTLQSLEPQKTSRGKEFASKILRDAVVPAATEVGKKFLTKKIGKMLGVDDDEVDGAFKKLEKESKIADFKKKIAESEMANRKNEKEKNKDKTEADKKAEKESKKTDSDTGDKKETFTGEVFGEGTSKRSTDSTSSSTKKKSRVIIDDDSWSDKTASNTSVVPYKSKGQSFIAGLLDEPKE